MGGARPRRRPREANDGQEGGGFQTLLGLLPIILFFILPMITSLFSGSSSTPSGPRMVYDNPIHPYTERRTTPNFGVEYFVNPADVAKYSNDKFNRLDVKAERNLIVHLRNECESELMYKQRLLDAAQGWFYQDPEKMAVAESYTMPSCERMRYLGIDR